MVMTHVRLVVTNDMILDGILLPTAGDTTVYTDRDPLVQPRLCAYYRVRAVPN